MCAQFIIWVYFKMISGKQMENSSYFSLKMVQFSSGIDWPLSLYKLVSWTKEKTLRVRMLYGSSITLPVHPTPVVHFLSSPTPLVSLLVLLGSVSSNDITFQFYSKYLDSEGAFTFRRKLWALTSVLVTIPCFQCWTSQRTGAIDLVFLIVCKRIEIFFKMKNWSGTSQKIFHHGFP